MKDKELALAVDRGYVTYEDFGAVGDGVTDDFAAILRTHEYANENGLTVKGTPGKTYYIFNTRIDGEVKNVYVRTNVDWCGAHFIIDDTPISLIPDNPYRDLAKKNIFIVMPDPEHEKLVIEDRETLDRIYKAGINKKTTHIDLGIDWAGPVMIIPYSSEHKVFRRRGYSQYAGEPMHEIILLDADGAVSDETPIMFDYRSLDYIEVYRLDPKSAITLENGVFTTRESRVNHKIKKEDGTYEFLGGYIARGMKVMRSYTLIKNIEHRLEGCTTLLERVDEDREGSPYAGFFRSEAANRITYKDCIMPGRFSYGVRANGHSSYNFGALCVNKIVLDGCVQPNFWMTVDPVTYELKDATIYDKNAIGSARRACENVVAGMGYVDVKGVVKPLLWGIGGTNYCKNMEYINSTLTRFDAHAGLYHGKIINCNISGMELTGVGDFVLEDSAWYPYTNNTPLLYLRADYGYHWDGDIKIKNTKAYMYDGSNLNIAHYYFNNWYYGYTCVFPNITIDNLRYYNAVTLEERDSYEAKLFLYRENAKRMHLPDAGVKCILGVVDEDGDGYIDEPLFDVNRDGKIDELDKIDLDGDGRVGNTSLKYDDYFGTENYRRGIEHPTCTVNVNPVRPPEYLKIINNTREDGSAICRYVIKDTSGMGISDGAWYRTESEPDTMGGFFGATKFIYGEGESECFVGTCGKDSESETFVFTKEFDV